MTNEANRHESPNDPAGIFDSSRHAHVNRDTALLDQDSEALQTLASLSGLGVWEWDSISNRLWWNSEMFRLFDVDPDAFAGTYESFSDRLDPADFSRVNSLVIATGIGDEFKTEYGVIHRDGSSLRIAASGRRIANASGEGERLLGVCLDVTDAWRAAKDADRYKLLFRAAEQMSGIGAWMLTKEGDVTWSDNVYRIHGLEVGDGKPKVELEWAKSFYPPEARVKVEQFIESAFEEGTGFDFELPFQDAHGQERIVHSKAIVERSPNGESTKVHGVFEDVTQRRASERQLKKQARLQKLLFEELDHRVRNNLGSLLSLIELGARSAQTVEDFAEAMSHRVRTMASIHTLVTRANYDVVPLEQILDAILDGDAGANIEYAGPTVQVPPEAVSPIAMVLAEMMMNARKYGALAHEGGQLSVRWARAVVEPDWLDLRLSWIECCTHPIERSHSKTEGVGLRIIHGMSVTELRGSADMEFTDSGLHGTFSWRLRPV